MVSLSGWNDTGSVDGARKNAYNIPPRWNTRSSTGRSSTPGHSEGDLMKAVLTLFGGYGLKGGNLLLHLVAFTLWALEFLPFILRDFYIEGKRLVTFPTNEVILGHGKLLSHVRFFEA
jgi:hypothetical protein